MTDSDFDDYYVTVHNHVGKATAKIELVQLPSIVLNDLSDTLTTLSISATHKYNDVENTKYKNLRNSLSKQTDSDYEKKSEEESINEPNYDNEFVFYKTTSSLINKQNKSTKNSSYRSNKIANQTNHQQKTKNRKQHQLENSEKTTSTHRYSLFNLENKSSSLIADSKFHIIYIQLIVFIYSKILNI